MATVQTNKRRQELCFTSSGEVPTVPSPPSLQWGDAGFISTDIMPGEFAINIPDKRIFTRTENNIVEIATSAALTAAIEALELSIPSGTDDLLNESSVSGTSTSDALDALLTLISSLQTNSQTVANLVQDFSAPAASTYPSSVAVNNALNLETLEKVRGRDRRIDGDIDFNGNTGTNVKNAAADGDIVPLRQLNAAIDEAKDYADAKVIGVFVPKGDYDASSGLYPSGTIKAGYTYRINVAGTIAGYQYDVGDTIYAIIDDPGQTAANWGDFEHNTQQASETIRGTAVIASAAQVADENSLNDSNIVTPKKLWANFVTRFLALPWTWLSKQTFSVAPRFSSEVANRYLKTDSNSDLTSVNAIPAADITESATLKFVPQAAADNDFLVGQASGNTWIKKTLAEAKTILGITTPPSKAVLTASHQTGITSTVFIDITGLEFTADANSTYFISWMLFVETTASNGFRTGINLPAGASMLVTQSWYGTNTSQVIDTSDQIGISNFTNIISPGWVRMEGFITTGASGGTVKGRILANNASNVLKVFAGSGGLVIKKQ